MAYMCYIFYFTFNETYACLMKDADVPKLSHG